METDCSSGDTVSKENPDYLSKQVITYIGNKRQLLPLIEQGIFTVAQELGKGKISTLDLFAGSGVVSRLFKQHATEVYANDLEVYSQIINECYLTNASPYLMKHLEDVLIELQNNIENNWCSDGFIVDMYAPKDDSSIAQGERAFYTRRNAEYLDTARQQIGLLPAEIQHFFLAPLLAGASVHANTSGVFKGFYKNKEGVGCYGGAGKNALKRILGDISVQVPILSNCDCYTQVTRLDARDAVVELPGVDLAYLDPPYNQHPYGSNYFMLNLVATYDEPESISTVSGIPLDWNRSLYNKQKKAKDELFHVVSQCKAQYILISYNSEGFVSYEEFITFLEDLGHLRVFETKYNTFRGSRNLRGRDLHVREYLFLLRRE